MSETSRIIRKFERDFLNGRSNISEVRPDTKGALSEEIQSSERRNSNNYKIHSTKGMRKIADITYYLDQKTVVTRNAFYHKSRGKK